ncbi:type II toxin-antitoxin system death-on-curing family toxin [Aquidulcibacter paucihalophilus]|uniref:type II toxin-antitoxin system death-on-curing family toxin n=1 Tax=Aquidulcibacter paucihalophilus TaxID=1978549 RepID=UPI000A19A4BA|nr:type II toxin-antitoxin system death-on-curing family toxin [Aquidulcibacter paucihalophilus]
MTEYLTLDEVLLIHADQIERYGGTHGVRDLGLIDSALSRPRSGYYGSTIEQAAALWESFAQNHAFLDGNKRTAFAVTYTFLQINGWRIRAGPDETYDFIAHLYSRQAFVFIHLVEWLHSNTSKA